MDVLPASMFMYHVLVLGDQNRVSKEVRFFCGSWEFRSFPDSLKAAMPPSHCLALVKV